MNLQAIERQRAFTALLAHPVLDRHADPELWVLVRRHRPQLTDWFDSRLGYRLVVTDTAARLFRLPVNGTVVAPVRPRPASRRVLVLALLAAVAAEDAEDLTSTQELSDRVRVLRDRAAPELSPYEPDRFGDRKLFVNAIELLTSVGALRPAGQGDTEEQLAGWAHSTDGIGGAYHVERELLLRLVEPGCLAAALATQPPGAGALGAQPPGTQPPGVGPPGTPTHRDQRVAGPTGEASPRRAVMRRLIELPACLLADLTEAERAYLAGQRHRLVLWCTEMTGWAVEQRAEGMALIPPEESGTDMPFPRVKADHFGALLILDALLRGGPAVIGRDRLDNAASEVCARYPKAVTAEYRDNPLRLADDALDLLRGLDLLRPAHAGWVTTPIAARFRDPAVVRVGDTRLDEADEVNEVNKVNKVSEVNEVAEP